MVPSTDDGRTGGCEQYPSLTTVAGWREWVSLPDLGVPWIKAKLDTGARSSAIHAFDLEELDHDGRSAGCASPSTRGRPRDEDPVAVESPLLDVRVVRSSSGHVEQRLVVRMTSRWWGATSPPR